ncbi:MAG: type II secretion system protein GspG [Planctomycetes bacterium]|nr:type II secretion system protein GspG [Planctomycetota bacterium]
MEGFSQERRGLFDGLKVPHNGNAVLIAALGLLVYYAGVRAIEEALGVPGEGSCRLLAGMLGNLSSFFGYPGQVVARIGGWSATWTEFAGYVWAAFAIWSVAVWAFLAGAITRIAAMKLAREEGLELKDALRFGARKFLSNIGSIAFVLIIIGFFYLLTNATIAGWIGRIPYVGGVLLGLFFGLVLVSSFLIVLAGALGVLGFNLAAAAISTEVSDAFDGVSRAWDYVLARPWNLLVTYLTTFLYLGIVVFLGLTFIEVSVRSLAVGAWGLGETARTITVDEAMRKAETTRVPRDLEVVYVPGRADFLYGQVIGRRYRPDEAGNIYYRQGVEYALERFKEHTGAYPESLEELLAPGTRAGQPIGGWRGPYLFMDAPPRDAWGNPFGYRRDGRGGQPYDLFSRGKDPGPEATHDDMYGYQGKGVALGMGEELNIAPFIEPSLKFAAAGARFWINLARLLLYGYCIAYFLSAQTTVYFLLRKEVEGEDYTEIMMEEEAEDHDEQPFEYGAPPAPAAPGDKPADAAGGPPQA